MGDGQITRKDIITDEALKWGDEYSRTIETAIAKNKEFVDSIILLNAENVKLRRSENQTEFIKQKNEIKIITEQSLGLLKEQTAAELSLEKIKKTSIDTLKAEEALKQAKLKTDKQTITNQQQLEKAQKSQNSSSAENTRIVKLQLIANQALAGSYEKIQTQLSLNTIKWKKLSEAERANTTEGKALTKEILNQENALKNLDAQLGKSQRNVGNYGSAFKSIGSSASSLLGAFGVVGGVSAIAAIATDIYKTTKELQSLDLALQTVTGTSKEFETQQQFLRKIAVDYGADLNSLTQSFIQFYASAKDKLAAEEIQNIFESVTKAGGVLGLSVERQEKAFLALNQMMSKGTIQAEELRGQLAEALPNSMGIMKNAVQELNPGMIVTEATLGKMMKDGKLLSAEVLPEFARQMEKTYGIENVKRVETLAAKTNRMTNEWTDFIRTLNESPTGGFFGSFFGTMMDMGGDFLKLLKDIVSAQAQIDKGVFNSAQQRGGEVFKQQSSQQNGTNQDKIDFAVNKSRGAAAEISNLNKELRLAEAQAEKTIVKFGSGYEALLKRVTDVKEQIGFQSGVNTAAKNSVKELSTPKVKVDSNNETDAERKSRLEKATKDKLDLEKQLSNALYELQKQRLEQNIKLNEDIISDETKTDEIRIQATYLSQTKQEDLVKLTKNYLLNNDKLVTNDRIRINEDASNKIIDINKKTKTEIDKINQFDEAKYQNDLEDKVSKINISMNSELQAENERFTKLGDLEAMAQADREKAIEDHERKIFEIKKEYAIKALKLQIANLETQLLANDALPANEQISAKKRQKIAETLSNAMLGLSEVGVSNSSDKSNKEVQTAKEKALQILEISSQLTGALSELAGSLFDTKIQKIDEEINANNEKYNKEIEAAGNNENLKKDLEKKRDKENEELEKKKRKEQHKQAVFNKAISALNVGISTSMAVISALAQVPKFDFGISAAAIATTYGIIGAVQLAAVLASPLPKYKMGRKGGPAEMAWVGDGGINEVIERKSGKIELTPNIPTLTQLGHGDIVHSSIDSYDKSIRASILESIGVDKKRISEFQSSQFFKNNNDELVKEMQLTRKAIEKNKTNVTVNVPKQDINHAVWAAKNKNWGQ